MEIYGKFNKKSFKQVIIKYAAISIMLTLVIIPLLIFFSQYSIIFIIILFLTIFYISFIVFINIKGYTNKIIIKEKYIQLEQSKNRTLVIPYNNIKNVYKMYNFSSTIFSRKYLEMYSQGLIFPSKYYHYQLFIELQQPVESKCIKQNGRKMKFRKLIICDNENYELYEFIRSKID
jgi:hypothetical protein